MNTTLQSLFASSYFNTEVLRALARDRNATLAEPVIGPYCILSKSLVNDSVARVEDFVHAIR